jgi:hypothetical protein
MDDDLTKSRMPLISAKIQNNNITNYSSMNSAFFDEAQKLVIYFLQY